MGVSPTKPMPVELDDPEDLEDAVIRGIIRHGPRFTYHKVTFVLGHGALPPRWKPLAFNPISLQDARDQLDIARAGGLTMAKLRVFAVQVAKLSSRSSDTEIQDWAATELLQGDLWIVRSNANVSKGKADPAVFAAVNAQFGTKIDFGFLAQWEGGQYLHGYVPFSKGVVAGASGVTIATGFDIGQKSEAEIINLKFPAAVETAIKPFATHRFPGKTRAEVIAAVRAIGSPIPVISKGDADTVDKIVHADILEGAIGKWNGSRAANVPSFTQLPEPWQTVIFSRFYHQGKYTNTKAAPIKEFWAAATTGDWQGAIDKLKAYPVTAAWYKARVTKEAAHLAKQLPPAVVQPPAAAPKAKK